MEKDFDNTSLKNLRDRFIARGNASQTEIHVERARGAIITDVNGEEYIDFSGGIAVMNVGHSHPKVIAAIKEQVERFTHTCFMVLPYKPAIELAEKLCASVPGDFPKSAFFTNSGAEAVENAIKIARSYSKRPAIIAFENGFHGRTLLTMSLTGKVKPYKSGFGPFAPEIYRMPFAYCYRCPFKLNYPGCDVVCGDYLEEFFITHVGSESVAAIIAEPIQGEGGFITPPPGYFSKLKRICEKHGILFIADEIQTGMGRTGEMFALSNWNVEADLTTVAKSLAAGMPLSAVVGRKEIMDAAPLGGIGGTYGGNPVSCSSALAVFEIFETENILEKALGLGKTLRSRFDDFKQTFEIIGDVRGLGPMLALELVKDRMSKIPATEETKTLIQFCRDRHLILLSCGAYGNVVRALMPLNIGEKELERGLSIMEDGFRFLQNWAGS